MYGHENQISEGAILPLTWAGSDDINEIFMFGVPNEGSAEAFAALLHGYSITDGTGNHHHLFHKLSRVDGLTGLSVFQLMPHGQTIRFLDGNLKPIRIDIYDPVAWKRYGWYPSYDARFRRR